VLAVVHDLTNYGVAICNYLHQIKSGGLSLGKRVSQANYAHLGAFGIDQADLFDVNLIVNPRFFGITFIRGSGISFDSCISNSLIKKPEV